MKHLRTVVGAVLALIVTAGCGGSPAAEPAPRATPSKTVSTFPSDSPTVAALEAGVPVWWDADGLHRGDTVQKTAIPVGDYPLPHLALVRSGALYNDRKTGDIWFHPWGGAPRVVGHGSAAGPGGDPEGDTAAWFEDRELVVYDTARDEVISRTSELAAVSSSSEYVEHLGHGNGWVYLSSTQVVWRYSTHGEQDAVGRRDLVSGKSELPWRPRPSTRSASTDGAGFVDVSAVSAVWVVGRAHAGHGTYLVDRAGSEEILRVPELEYSGRLSPDGSWLVTPELADGTHGVAITDVDSGKTWKPFKKNTYAFFSWAYGDVAVMLTHETGGSAIQEQLISCSASERSCERLETRGRVVLPNP